MTRKIIVRTTFEYEMTEPAEWTPEEINFYYNHSRLCATKFLDKLNAICEAQGGCICDQHVETIYLREADKIIETDNP